MVDEVINTTAMFSLDDIREDIRQLRVSVLCVALRPPPWLTLLTPPAHTTPILRQYLVLEMKVAGRPPKRRERTPPQSMPGTIDLDH